MTTYAQLYRFNFPTTIYFGVGARHQIREHLEQQGLHRPLIVTDRGVAALSPFQRLLEELDAASLTAAVFSDSGGDPAQVLAAATTAYGAHAADCVIGLGGGACDLLFSGPMLARAVYADPELSLGLPPSLTTATGMDALARCIEAYLAKGFHPICDGIALEGIRLCAGSLVRSYREPQDIEARGNVLMASMMSAIASQKGLGLTHSCAGALSAATDMHHGLANGVMINHTLGFNASVVPERFRIIAATIAATAGATPTINPSAAGEGDAGVMAWLRGLKRELGIPSRLSEAGARRDQLERLGDLAMASAGHASNPRVVTREDLARIFNEAF